MASPTQKQTFKHVLLCMKSTTDCSCVVGDVETHLSVQENSFKMYSWFTASFHHILLNSQCALSTCWNLTCVLSPCLHMMDFFFRICTSVCNSTLWLCIYCPLGLWGLWFFIHLATKVHSYCWNIYYFKIARKRICYDNKVSRFLT